MDRRLLLATGLLLLVAVTLLIASFRPEATPLHAAVQEPGEEPSVRAAELSHGVGPEVAPESRAALDREEVEPAEPQESRAPRLLHREAAGDEQVVVRVHLELAAESGFALGGRTVEAQSWIGETDETFVHEAVTDEDGMAVLRFAEPVHIDWVKYLPPPESGLGLALVEEHIDLSLGAVYEKTLQIGSGCSLLGTVLHTDGRPVAGVEIHAYYNGDVWSDLNDWNPGPATAVSGPDGTFELRSLCPGTWGIAVRPRGWLQVHPNLDDPEDGVSLFQLQAGQRRAAGVFRVTELHRFEVTVEDPAGRPLAGMRLRLEPLEFHTPALQLSGGGLDGPSGLQKFLSGQPAGALPASGPGVVRWYYGALNSYTGEDGVAQCLAVPGAWNLTLAPRMERGSAGAHTYERALQVPSGDVRVTYPYGLMRFEGRVVNTAGEPVSRVRVRLLRDFENQTSSDYTRSDGSGKFVFQGLVPSGEYRLRLQQSGYVTGEWNVAPGSGSEPQTYVMRPSRNLRLEVRDPAGEPIVGHRFALLSGVPDATVVPLQPGEASLLETAKHFNSARRTNRRGEVSLVGLLPGTYEVGLMLPYANGSYDGRGNPRLEYRLFQSWSLPVQDEPHELVVDLGTYTPPPARQQTVYFGVVRDASTGSPLEDATVHVEGLESRSRRRIDRTDSDGEFRIVATPGRTRVTVARDGYVPLSFETSFEPGEQSQEFRLQPGGREVVVLLRDRQGQPLPGVEVNLLDEAGRAVYADLSQHRGEFRWRSNGFAPEGELRMKNVRAGLLRIEVEFWNHEAGSCEIRVAEGSGQQEITARLPKSLDEIRAEMLRARDD